MQAPRLLNDVDGTPTQKATTKSQKLSQRETPQELLNGPAAEHCVGSDAVAIALAARQPSVFTEVSAVVPTDIFAHILRQVGVSLYSLWSPVQFVVTAAQ